MSQDLRRARALRVHPAGAARRRLRVAEPDPGAGDPGAAGGPRRDRPGPDGHRQDGRVRAADHGVRRSRASTTVQALVLTPTRELCIQVTQALRTYGAHKRRRRRGGLRRRADPHPAGAAARRRARRRGHRRARARPDLAPLAGAARLPLRGARRGRRDARPRLPRGRREDPLADALQPPDGAVLGDHAAADPQARRPLHVRPGDHPGRGGDADDRHRRAVPAAGRDARTSRTSWSRC